MKNYLALSPGETKRTADDNILTYATGPLITELSFSEYDSDVIHIQASTKWFDIESQDESLVMRVCHELSILVGFTVAYSPKDRAIYSLASVTYNSGSPLSTSDFEAAKLRIFLLLTMQINAISNQVVWYLAEMLDVDVSDKVGFEYSIGSHFPQSIAHRIKSPDLLFDLASIQTELETEVSFLTGRINLAQIFDEGEEKIRKSHEFAYGEEEGAEGPSIVASFHASYFGKGIYGDSKPLHAGVVIDRATTANIDELTELAWGHFNNPLLSLLGYYYPGRGLAGCYVTRLQSFFVEVLSREIPEFTNQSNLKRFQVLWCLDAYRNYRRLENVSRSNREVTPEAHGIAKSIAENVWDQWFTRSNSWPRNPKGARWPLVTQYEFGFKESSVRRLVDIYLGIEFEDFEPEYGTGKITLEITRDEKVGVLSLSVVLPEGTTDFTSPVFEYTPVQLELHINSLVLNLRDYHQTLGYVFGDCSPVEEQIVDAAIGQIKNFEISKISNSELTIEEIPNFVANSWNDSVHFEAESLPPKIKFKGWDSNKNSRSFEVF